MCGIAGVFHEGPQHPIDAAAVAAMTHSLQHRGPDGDGVRIGPGYGLGHRRLSIVDLGGGAQPMTTADGALWVTFNGEIYNHLELRRQLEQRGCRFRTASDTEVLLHGYREYGTALAEKLHGMFAFVLVDERKRELYAARDRLGKKPLHWTMQDGAFVFASELKALRAFGIHRPLRADALAQFLCLRYVPDPLTVFADVHKLPPAHWLVLRHGEVTTQRYWQLSFAQQTDAGVEQLCERALELLDQATAARLMGEVPLAPFLSGGVDSYAVTDSMTRILGHPVKACTVGFDDPAFDERPAARANARACGAELEEEVVHGDDLLDLDWYADTFDEPFADSSAVPTFHVCRLARRHVTVALSGDGGDESFAGYRRYLFDRREHRVRGLLPALLWRWFGAVYPKADWLPRWLRARRTLQNLGLPPDQAYAHSVSASLPAEVFTVLRQEHHAAAGDPLQPLRQAYRAADGGDALRRACATDFATWLPGDILVKVDRASMATGLEVRAPFLDHRMVEFAATIPSAVLLQGGRTKALLRRALAGRLDPAALQRRKQGFSVPLRRWLAGPVGAALAARLDDQRLGEWLDPSVLRRLLAAHRSGRRDHSELLWSSLVLARFLERWAA